MLIKLIIWGIKRYLRKKLSKAVYDKVVELIDDYRKK